MKTNPPSFSARCAGKLSAGLALGAVLLLGQNAAANTITVNPVHFEWISQYSPTDETLGIFERHGPMEKFDQAGSDMKSRRDHEARFFHRWAGPAFLWYGYGNSPQIIDEDQGVAVPDGASSLLLLGSGLVTLAAFHRKHLLFS